MWPMWSSATTVFELKLLSIRIVQFLYTNFMFVKDLMFWQGKQAKKPEAYVLYAEDFGCAV